MDKFNNSRIISGSSHYELAFDISKITIIPIIDVEHQYFANGEYRPIIKESIKVKDMVRKCE